MKVYLIGLPSSGKTTLGKSLAASLKSDFIDMDELIEKEEGCSISDIFEKEDETYFRKVEQSVLVSLLGGEDNVVVSTGGGAPCFFDNMKRMLSDGICIYLKVSPAELVSRLGKTGVASRPLLTGTRSLQKEIEDKLHLREAFYLNADHTLEGDNLHLNDLLNVVKYGVS